MNDELAESVREQAAAFREKNDRIREQIKAAWPDLYRYWQETKP